MTTTALEAELDNQLINVAGAFSKLSEISDPLTDVEIKQVNDTSIEMMSVIDVTKTVTIVTPIKAFYPESVLNQRFTQSSSVMFPMTQEPTKQPMNVTPERGVRTSVFV